MWNKLKKPKKISLAKIKNYFLSVGLKRLVKDYENFQILYGGSVKSSNSKHSSSA